MAEDTWQMAGMDWDDPMRIRTWQELVSWIDEIGFLPLFRCQIPGFSVEEHTASAAWWTGDPEQDPWVWRELIARSSQAVYGKFFEGKSGFVSRAWFPKLVNWRRDGYDFDTLWEEGLAKDRSRKLMDCLTRKGPISSVLLKKEAGFGKGGEKNFSGIVTELQMQTYLVASDFRQKVSKAGLPYGMPITILAAPEAIWGYETVTAAYSEEPKDSLRQIHEKILSEFPWASADALKQLIG